MAVFRMKRDFLSLIIKIIFSVGLVAFIDGFLLTLTGDIMFVVILPIVFIILAFIISFIIVPT